MIFLESSAKTRVGISQVFTECVMQILGNPQLMNQGLGAGIKLEAGSAATGEEEDSARCCS
jgi:hypothetical protein